MLAAMVSAAAVMFLGETRLHRGHGKHRRQPGREPDRRENMAIHNATPLAAVVAGTFHKDAVSAADRPIRFPSVSLYNRRQHGEIMVVRA
jgi:hypothetical protein